MLGIAGTVGTQRDYAMRATEGMAAYLVTPDRGCSRVESAGRQESSAVLAAVGLELSALDAGSCSMSIARDEDFVAAISGAVDNLAELCQIFVGDRLLAERGAAAEILIALYRRCGTAFISQLRGMFAIAIWDEKSQQLLLARDRFALASLYFGLVGDTVIFASKVRALLASGMVAPRLSQPGLLSFLSYGFVYEPETIVDGIEAFPPAHWALIQGNQFKMVQYWDFFEDRPEMDISLEAAAAELRPMLEDSVRRQLQTQLSPCVFLSGGMDSSILAALANQEVGQVSTVSILLEDETYSEQPNIELVNAHLNARPHYLSLSSRLVRDWLPDYFAIMDQPVIDGFNVFSTTRFAVEQGFSMALYGMGSDELFGKLWHMDHLRLFERFSRLPTVATAPVGWFLGKRWSGNQGAKTREWLTGGASPGGAYELLRRTFLESELRRLWRGSVDLCKRPRMPVVEDLDYFARMNAQFRINVRHRNEYSRSADWASTSQGLQIRMPYLDIEIVEWAVRLPVKHKEHGYKPVLAKAAADLLPPAIFTQPKKGFHVPLRSWMRDELRDLVEPDFVRPISAVTEFLNPDEIRKVWERYLSNGERWKLPWSVYALSRWMEQALPIPNGVR